MNEIKLYIEFHWGKRRPNLNYFLNGKEILPLNISVVEKKQHQENILVLLSADFQQENLFEIKMSDKTDQDIVFTPDNHIDHWAKVRQIELDQIKLDALMYRICKFSHSMSQDWVKNMSEQGHDILPCYPGGTDIRLNGTWSINFELPVWEWNTRNL